MYNPNEECELMITKLNRLCKKRGINHYTLAKHAHVSTSTVSCLLNGKTKPQVYTLLLLCNALEIPIYELFSDGGMIGSTDNIIQQVAGMEQVNSENKFSELTEDEKKLLQSYQNLSATKRKLLKIYVEMLLQYSD